MDTLDILVKELNKLETYTAKYIYKKYIETDETPGEPQDTEDTTTGPTSELKFKYSKKPNNTGAYKLYLYIIFIKERKHIIKQNDITSSDL